MFCDICKCTKPCNAKTESRLSEDIRTNQNIVTPPWPAKRPDLEPIEYVWDILWRNVRSHYNVGTSPQIITALRSEWGTIAQNDIRIIIGSMFCQYLACVEAKLLIKHSVTFKMTPTLFFDS